MEEYAPGYRHISLKVDINRGNGRHEEVELEFSKEDTKKILYELVRLYGLSMSDKDEPMPIDWDEQKDTMGILETFCKENWQKIR